MLIDVFESTEVGDVWRDGEGLEYRNYIATVRGGQPYRGRGKSPDEAIGNLISTYPDAFNVVVFHQHPRPIYQTKP